MKMRGRRKIATGNNNSDNNRTTPTAGHFGGTADCESGCSFFLEQMLFRAIEKPRQLWLMRGCLMH
jgi:hypothetical protein